MDVLSVSDLWVSFGDQVVLHGVNLNIRPGEIVAVVGESGSGKSVLARSILGLSGAKVEGRIDFMGRELTGLSEAALTTLRGSAASLMVQDAQSALNPVYRVGTQLMEMLAHKHPEFARERAPFWSPSSAKRDRRQRMKAAALELLREVGLAEECFQAFPHQLSGGMSQRVMLALSMLGEPKLLIADEPTTALDVVIQKQILHRLVDSARQRATALMLISHDLHLVGELADRVAVLYAGHVMECGPTADILANPANPYTRGLLAVMPRTDTPKGSLKPIPGEVPPPDQRDQGCQFRSRCRQAESRCAAAPDYIALGRDWVTLCHYPPLGRPENFPAPLAA